MSRAKPTAKTEQTVESTVDLMRWSAPYNPRKIDPEEFDKLQRLMRDFGVVQPIVCNRRSQAQGFPAGADPVIVGGHQRVRAAVFIGLAELPVAWIDVPEGRERVLNLGLNRVGGEFDDDLVRQALADLEQFGLTGLDAGFDQDELDRYAAELEAELPDDEVEASGKGSKGAVTVVCPSCGETFDA